MTKETKIGLLVGLAFILAVGILLSDHLTTSNEPPPARLDAAGGIVRAGLGEATDVPNPTAVVRLPRSIAPPAPVVTATELAAARARRKPAVAAAVAAPTVTVTPPSPLDVSDLPPTALAVKPVEVAPVPPSQNPELIAGANRHGEPVVAVKPAARSAGRTVEAESGDTLADLAERAYGSNTKTTRAALVAANPALKADPGRIVAGRAYNVAGGGEATSPAESVAVLYTVKAGDTLWSIAGGSPQTVDAIRKLNKDVLHGNGVHPKMRLKLPKGLATAE